MEKVLEHLQQNKDTYLEELFELLRIPSISAQEDHDRDVAAAAQWLRDHLEGIGLENSQVLATDGHPIVYADWMHAKDKPTVLIYGHYDVQAADPLEEWKSEPFEPEVRDGNMYARGTSDNKGQIFAHIKAIEALFKVKEKLPVNVKFFIEGEEEVGGPSMEKFVEGNKELLSADICVISDSHALSETQPLIDYGLKGLVYTQLELSVMPQDVHSGLYGGNVPNAGIELVNLIAKLKDNDTQKVLIPGFYENVRELSERELEELSSSTFTEDTVLEETGAKKVLGDEDYGIADRAGAKPTLDINGMISGYTGKGPKTIIPGKAMAKVSMRIVPNQTAEEITKKFTEFVNEISPEYADISIEIISKDEPILMDRDNEYFERAEKVLKEAFGNAPLYEMSGGSIPVTAVLKTILGIDTILMGFGLPDDGLHSPNEKMSIQMFNKGMETSARFYLSFE